MKFSREFIDQVRDANNIVDIISRQTPLKKAGGQYMGLCPFPDHREKTASFSVSESKQLYYCFGCKKAGNIFNFVEVIMGMNFPEAVEWLARQAGIPIPQEAILHTIGKASQEIERRSLVNINEQAKCFFVAELSRNKDGSQVRSYLYKRGISSDTIERFQLGYSPNEWESLSQAMASRQFSLKDVESLGLIRHRREGREGYYDLFRGRLIFPILGLDGTCLGFGGRSMDDTEPKYLNSPESLLFHKSRIFYGLFETAKYLRAKDQAIVVEGYMDLLSLFQSGIRNVVAPLGTALTSEQARLIRRYTTHVIMLFDGDNAGQLAMERSLPILLSEGLLPRALQLPEGMDPDDFIQKNGRNELEALLASAPELFVLVLNKWMEGYRGSSSEKIVIIDKASVLFRAISDTRLKDLYLAELALRLGVNQKWLQKSLEKGQNVRYDALKQEENSQDLHTTHVRDTREATDSESQKEIIRISGKLPKAEEQLVNLALMNERCLVKIRDSQVAEMFVHSGLRKILETSFLLYGQLPNKFDKLTSLLVSQVDAPEVLLKHLEKHLADLDSEGARTLVEDCSRKVRDAFLRNQSRQLSAGLRGRSTTEQLKQLEQIMNIQLDRRVQRYDNEPS